MLVKGDRLSAQRDCTVEHSAWKYVSGRTRVYYKQAGLGYPVALAGRDMPEVVGCAASQRCLAAQHPLTAD